METDIRVFESRTANLRNAFLGLIALIVAVYYLIGQESYFWSGLMGLCGIFLLFVSIRAFIAPREVIRFTPDHLWIYRQGTFPWQEIRTIYVEEVLGSKNKRKYYLRAETVTESGVIHISDLTHDADEIRELVRQYASTSSSIPG